MASHAAEAEPVLNPREVLLSIVGFWLFYFTVVTLRAFALGYEDQIGMLPRRAGVTIASMGLTWLFYLLLRRMRHASMRRLIVVAVAAALPAALTYATINKIAFLGVDDPPHASTRVVVSPSSERADPASPTVPPLPPIPPRAPAPPGSAVSIQVSDGAIDEAEKSPLVEIVDQAANGYFFFVAWAALYLALSYAAQVRRIERQAARFRAAAQAAELRALRYQVNPHFLFNTLNSLSSLVLSDRRDEAERMIMNLATFFRTSLTGDPTEDVRLAEEIRLQRLYLDIEAVRFPDRLLVEIDVPDALLSACVPGLILQPLVENAIKHGVSPARRPVRLRIAARAEGRCLVLRVEDDGDAAEPAPGGHGVGLRNVRDRLAARFGKESDSHWGALPGGGFAVTLYMPLVRNDC